MAARLNGRIGPRIAMPRKSKLQAANLDGDADEIEAAFYDALQNGDIDKLMACWADEDEIVCIHPGGPRVVGGVAIRATFEAMFANGSIRAWPQQLRKTRAWGARCTTCSKKSKCSAPKARHRPG
jgi:ketosteroid isomerase-like protein